MDGRILLEPPCFGHGEDPDSGLLNALEKDQRKADGQGKSPPALCNILGGCYTIKDSYKGSLKKVEE